MPFGHWIQCCIVKWEEEVREGTRRYTEWPGSWGMPLSPQEFWKVGFLHLSEATGACWLTILNTSTKQLPQKEGSAWATTREHRASLAGARPPEDTGPGFQGVSSPQPVELHDPKHNCAHAYRNPRLLEETESLMLTQGSCL